LGREWAGAADDVADDDDDDIIAGIEIEETENGVFVLSIDSVDDNEEESSESTDSIVLYDFKTEVTVE